MAFTKKSTDPYFLADLERFANAMANEPYELLGQHYTAAGWKHRLIETSAVPAYSGTTQISFDLYVAKDDGAFERFDQLTMSIAPGPGPVSVAARLAARESVIFMLSGRLPPAQPTRAQTLDTVPITPTKPNGAAVPAPEPAAQNAFHGEYSDAEDPAPADLERVTVIDHLEPDGLPIFRDLYEIGEPEVANTGEIVEAVLEDIASFLNSASSLEQVDALAAKNEDAMAFLKDLGTEKDLATLKSLVAQRRNELQRPPGAVPPRRRVPAAARSN